MIEREAALFFSHLVQECGEEKLCERWQEINREIEITGTYTHTPEELSFGARLAWRNSTRCIGRLPWQSLQVRDMRHLVTAEEVFEAIVEHIQMATNAGKIQAIITIFDPQTTKRPGISIWNAQLFSYAGYRQTDGSVIGDPDNCKITTELMRLGWEGGQGTPFDLLPIAIQMPGKVPRLFELPYEIIAEVPLSHPEYHWFADLGLKWYALPSISNMRLEIGGISYTAAPFNGWYMGTEIGARVFGDVSRYNLLPVIAEKLGLSICSERSLWKDRALVELNIAVLHSFQVCGVTMVDHHTADRQFQIFAKNERSAGRVPAGDWGWLIPPMSASTTALFFTNYENRIQVPNFFTQPAPWAYDEESTGVYVSCPISI